MNSAYLFLYGLFIFAIALWGGISYSNAKRREHIKDAGRRYANWGDQ